MTLADAIRELDKLSPSEVRQLWALLKERLGEGASGSGINKSRSNPGPRGNSPRKSSKKGNPNRKSQWENHPLYQDYAKLKRLVKVEAKKEKVSFKDLRSETKTKYDQALTIWLEAKSTFRDHTGQKDKDEAETGQILEPETGSDPEQGIGRADVGRDSDVNTGSPALAEAQTRTGGAGRGYHRETRGGARPSGKKSRKGGTAV
jgi:hypothetical protein